MDIIYRDTTWHRQVLLSDDTDAPFDPTDVTAVLCPATPVPVTNPDPGVYVATLTDTDTASLLPGVTHWELYGTVGSDVVLLVTEPILVVSTCLAAVA